jgi:hypothetical protein
VRIPPGSFQDVTIGIVAAKPDPTTAEVHPSGQAGWRSYVDNPPEQLNKLVLIPSPNPRPVIAHEAVKSLVFWYEGSSPNTSDAFFTHGGFFSPKKELGVNIVSPPAVFPDLGKNVTLMAAFAAGAPPDGTLVGWDFGDGSFIDLHPAGDAGALVANHAFSLPGDFVVYVIAVDPDGHWGMDTCIVSAGGGTNQPPIARAGTDQVVEQTGRDGAPVTLDGSASSDPDGDSLGFTWTGPFGTAGGPTPLVTLPLGKNVVTLTVDDGRGATSSATVTITVRDTQPPVLSNVIPSMTVEQTSRNGTTILLPAPTVSDICDAAPSLSNNAPAVFPLGVTVVTWKAVDASGNQATATTTVTVVDTTPPTITSISANPGTLWPPNHKMVPVVVSVTATDLCDAAPVSQIVGITSNQPVTGSGPDWQITGTLNANLRADRSGQEARIYTLTIRCTDFSGNSSFGTVTVTVPHDQGVAQ